jgi:hypothetical protein
MSKPRRLDKQAGRYALVDGIPFHLPVDSQDSSALMAGFTVDGDKVAQLLPGNELHPVRLPNGKGLLMVTVIDYRKTDIGKYIEYSIALACTHGDRPKSLLRSVVFMNRSGTGQFVWDLPVSTEISVKGGKGIWGMPKHQANLDYDIDSRTVASQYDLDGKLCTRIEIKKPRFHVPLSSVGAVNWCAFRGMLMKSSIYFSGRAYVAVGRFAKATFTVGSHERMNPLRELGIAQRPLFTAWLPDCHGLLDDHYEGWFLSQDQPPAQMATEGFDSVIDLTNDETWLAPPKALQ